MEIGKSVVSMVSFDDGAFQSPEDDDIGASEDQAREKELQTLLDNELDDEDLDESDISHVDTQKNSIADSSSEHPGSPPEPGSHEQPTTPALWSGGYCAAPWPRLGGTGVPDEAMTPWMQRLRSATHQATSTPLAGTTAPVLQTPDSAGVAVNGRLTPSPEDHLDQLRAMNLNRDVSAGYHYCSSNDGGDQNWGQPAPQLIGNNSGQAGPQLRGLNWSEGADAADRTLTAGNNSVKVPGVFLNENEKFFNVVPSEDNIIMTAAGGGDWVERGCVWPVTLGDSQFVALAQSYNQTAMMAAGHQSHVVREQTPQTDANHWNVPQCDSISPFTALSDHPLVDYEGSQHPAATTLNVITNESLKATYKPVSRINSSDSTAVTESKQLVSFGTSHVPRALLHKSGDGTETEQTSNHDQKYSNAGNEYLERLEILYQARGHKLEEIKDSMEKERVESTKQIHMLKHQVAMVTDQKDGLVVNFEQSSKLVKELQKDKADITSQLQLLRQQISAGHNDAGELRERLEVAKADIDSQQQELVELKSTGTVSRIQNDHRQALAQVEQRHQAECSELRGLIDELRNTLTLRTGELEGWRLKYDELTQDREKEGLERAETVSKLTRHLEDTQRQLADLCHKGSSSSLQQLQSALDQSKIGKRMAEGLCESLQCELRELREQLQLYDAASRLVDSGIPSSNTASINQSEICQQLQASILNQSKITDLNEEIREMHCKAKKLEENLDLESTKFASLNSQLQYEKEKRSEAESQLEAIRSGTINPVKITELEEEIANLHEEVEAYDKLKSSLEARVKEIEDECNDSRKAMIDLVNQSDKDKEIAMDQVRESCLRFHEDARANLRNQLTAEFETRIETITGEHEKEMEQMQQHVQEAMADVYTVKGNYVSLCEEKRVTEKALAAELEEKTQIISSLSKDVEQCKKIAYEKEQHEIKDNLAKEFDLVICNKNAVIEDLQAELEIMKISKDDSGDKPNRDEIVVGLKEECGKLRGKILVLEEELNRSLKEDEKESMQILQQKLKERETELVNYKCAHELLIEELRNESKIEHKKKFAYLEKQLEMCQVSVNKHIETIKGLEDAMADQILGREMAVNDLKVAMETEQRRLLLEKEQTYETHCQELSSKHNAALEKALNDARVKADEERRFFYEEMSQKMEDAVGESECEIATRTAELSKAVSVLKTENCELRRKLQEQLRTASVSVQTDTEGPTTEHRELKLKYIKLKRKYIEADKYWKKEFTTLQGEMEESQLTSMALLEGQVNHIQQAMSNHSSPNRSNYAQSLLSLDQSEIACQTESNLSSPRSCTPTNEVIDKLSDGIITRKSSNELVDGVAALQSQYSETLNSIQSTVVDYLNNSHKRSAEFVREALNLERNSTKMEVETYYADALHNIVDDAKSKDSGSDRLLSQRISSLLHSLNSSLSSPNDQSTPRPSSCPVTRQPSYSLYFGNSDSDISPKQTNFMTKTTETNDKSKQSKPQTSGNVKDVNLKKDNIARNNNPSAASKLFHTNSSRPNRNNQSALMQKPRSVPRTTVPMTIYPIGQRSVPNAGDLISRRGIIEPILLDRHPSDSYSTGTEYVGLPDTMSRMAPEID